jgi:restriction system protein
MAGFKVTTEATFGWWARPVLAQSPMSRSLVGGTGDGGVDGTIEQDHLGLDRIYVQAKRYAEGNTVGSGAIRDFFGSLERYKATKGLFVTAPTFSPSARQTANN